MLGFIFVVGLRFFGGHERVIRILCGVLFWLRCWGLYWSVALRLL